MCGLERKKAIQNSIALLQNYIIQGQDYGLKNPIDIPKAILESFIIHGQDNERHKNNPFRSWYKNEFFRSTIQKYTFFSRVDDSLCIRTRWKIIQLIDHNQWLNTSNTNNTICSEYFHGRRLKSSFQITSNVIAQENI